MPSGTPLSLEHRAKISAANKGKKKSAEHIKKSADARRGTKASPETKAKMSAAYMGHIGYNKGMPKTKEQKAYMSNLLKGRIFSPETRAKISANRKGMKFSKEHKDNISRGKGGDGVIRDRYAHSIRRNFGMTMEDYNQMLESQGGVCSLCYGMNKNGKRLGVDHNHQTGKVRGILCQNCNAAIGYAQENIQTLQNMIDYLKKHSD